MNRNFVTHYRNPAEFRRDHYARREQFQRDTALPRAAALIITVLSSLGLWWVVVLAGSRLVAALWG